MTATLRLFLSLTILAWTTTQALAVPGRAEVVKVVGTATVSKATGGSASITQGMVLGTGDTITTGAASTVDLNLGLNGDFLRVDPDSTLKISNLEISNIAERTVDTQLSLGKGGITGNVVTKLTKASKYEIKSASGVAGIRGTVYSVTLKPDGTVARIVVTQGTVTFIDRGVTITISATSQADAKVYVPPADGVTPKQDLVQPAGKTEASATALIGKMIDPKNGGSVGDAVATVYSNPADVSLSSSQFPARPGS